MSSETPVDPYALVLADLEAQRAKIDLAIETIRAVQAGAPIPVTQGSTAFATPAPQTPPVVQIEIDTFHSLTLAQAIKKYLAMRGYRKPASTQEIVEALKQGGQSGAEGANFTVVVNNSLNRMSAPDGEVSKVRRGVWGLKSWYEKAKDE